MATGEELYESEVLWPDHDHRAHHGHDVYVLAASAAAAGRCPSTTTPRTTARRDQPTCSAAGSSRPVDIPAPRAAATARWSGDADLADDVGGCGGGTMVPPHVMMSRRRRSEGEPGVAAFSLRSGTGRARRDLSHLRHSVLRMTGFIEG